MLFRHQVRIILKKIVLVFVLVAIVTGAFGACERMSSLGQQSLDTYSISFFAMNTHMHIEAVGVDAEQAVGAAEAEIYRLEALFSRMDYHSELYQINHSDMQEPVVVSEELIEILSFAFYFAQLTNGYFDPTIGPLMDLWGFTDGDYHVPDDEDIYLLLDSVGYEYLDVDVQESSVQLMSDGMSLDLGGIAKGYASDAVLDILKSYDIETATVNLGGNVYVYGRKANDELYRVGIADPLDKNAYAGILSVSDMSVITSGGYERYFEHNGVKYVHIMDPYAGRPVQSDLISVTIVDASGIKGDALSTALFVMGRDKAIEFWRIHGGFGCVLIDSESDYYVSSDLMDVFEAKEGMTVYYFERGD